MSHEVKNIFTDLLTGGIGEDCTILFNNDKAAIERIVSHSHSSPAGFWYDQANDEWVVVLRGSATLEFADGEITDLKEGDWLTIPRHVKHRVARTGGETIWLAVHLK
jgi:cupin 2 domain-containing protein